MPHLVCQRVWGGLRPPNPPCFLLGGGGLRPLRPPRNFPYLLGAPSYARCAMCLIFVAASICVRNCQGQTHHIYSIFSSLLARSFRLAACVGSKVSGMAWNGIMTPCGSLQIHMYGAVVFQHTIAVFNQGNIDVTCVVAVTTPGRVYECHVI
jgi:hypothetical protein